MTCPREAEAEDPAAGRRACPRGGVRNGGSGGRRCSRRLEGRDQSRCSSLLNLHAMNCVIFAEPIPAPLPDVAMHVEQAKLIASLPTNRVGSVLPEFPSNQAILSQARLIIAERIPRLRPRPAGVFPFRLGRQAIARPGPVRDPHVLTVDFIKRLQALQLAQSVAELSRHPARKRTSTGCRSVD